MFFSSSSHVLPGNQPKYFGSFSLSLKLILTWGTYTKSALWSVLQYIAFPLYLVHFFSIQVPKY